MFDAWNEYFEAFLCLKMLWEREKFPFPSRKNTAAEGDSSLFKRRLVFVFIFFFNHSVKEKERGNLLKV